MRNASAVVFNLLFVLYSPPDIHIPKLTENHSLKATEPDKLIE